MLQVNFIMIYIIYEISVLFKYQNSKTVFKEYNRLFFFLKKKKITTYNDGKFKAWRKNIIQGVKTLFRLEDLKKEATDTTIKNIRNLFRLKKKIKKLKTE